MRFDFGELSRAAICDLVVIVGVIAAAGCDSKDPAPVAMMVFDEVKGNGTVQGKVSFEGTPPVMKEIRNVPCHESAPALKEETVVVGADGGLANVLVRVEGLPAVDGSGFPQAVLDQVHCRYVPHVLGVTVAQKLVIRSSDDTVHNVHYAPAKNPPANFGMTSAGSERVVSFSTPETIRVKCDVHPWMTAYVHVVENPFFAVTAADGTFEITDLPAGRYTISAWHEQYGRLEQPVEIGENQVAPVEASFTYKAP